MAIEVIKCPACGMRYNASDYAQCPYCKSGKGKKSPVSAPAPIPVEDNSMPKTMPLSAVSLHQNTNTEPDPQPVIVSDAPREAASVTRNDPPAPAPEPIAPAYTPAASAPVPPQPVQPLSSRVQDIGKTTAKFISTSGGETIFPVVGWLVCVKGIYFGKSFPLRGGVNRVSRSEDAEVSLPRDKSVSSHPVVRIAYDTKSDKFNALPGDSSSLCYINGEAMYDRMPLNGFEEIELGDSEQNKFIFIPLCGDNFSWSKYAEPNKE